jgi:hypothetical protein
MTPAGEKSLRDAQEQYQQELPKGARCPCCGRWGKVNRYTIGRTAVRALVVLVRLYERTGTWVHSKEIAAAIAGIPVEKILACTGDGLTKLVHWDAVEAKPNSDDPTKRDTGYWQPTRTAVEFVHGRLRLPRWAEVYDNRLLKLDDSQTVSVEDALREKFNYAEQMASIASTAPRLANKDGPAP